MKNFPFPLRFSIPIVLVLFSSVLGLASFHREITETYETTELTASRYAQSLGSQIAGTLDYLYRRDDAEQAEIVISQLGSDSRLDLVLVVDEGDRILLSNHYEFRQRVVSEVLGTYDTSNLMPTLTRVREKIAGEISLSQDRQHIYVIYPVFLQAKPGELRPSRVGVLFMKYDLRREKQAAYEKAWQRNLTNSSALLLFCVALWLFFDVTLTRRINRLVVVSNSLANGDFSVRTGLSGSDEVAQLSVAFDRMADGVQDNTKALHRQNAILKAQQEAAIDGILIVDEHWHVISYNQRFCQLWQLPTNIHIIEHQQLLKSIVAQLMQPDEFLAKIKFLNQQPEAASRDEILLKNGCIVDCYSASVTSLTGEHYGRIWYFRDISDLKQSEEEIKRVQWFLDAIIENIPNMIFVKDAEELRFVRINKAGEDLLGYPREELLGKNDYDFFTKDEADFFTSKDRDILATGNILDISEEPIHTKHQGIKILHTKKLPITDETSDRQYILGISEDITERKQADIELRQAKESAEAANRAKSEFLANMSHELRTPLNAILGFAQLLTNSSGLDADQQENIRIISRSGQHLLNLINQILDISKIEAGRIVLNEQDFDFYSVLDELEEMFYLQARKKGLKFTVICSPEVPRHIQADPLKLRQVLINLLSNAIKFTEVGTVSLQVHVKDKPAIAPPLALLAPCTLSFELKDTGIGIPPDQIHHVFEAFTQLQTGKEAGTGLGLTISRHFVHLMNGEISVSSTLGQGTVVTVDLPVKAVRDRTTSPSKAQCHITALAPNQPRYRILIVDDDTTNRRLLFKCLEPLGFELKEAANGQEAIDIWADWRPHLIWMDLRMPVMDGYHATQRIKSQLHDQRTVIIALTATVFSQHQATILASGFDDFVGKPVSRQVLLDKIAQHLGVRYVYETLSQPSEQPFLERTEPKSDELKKYLSKMSPEWIEQLEDMAIRGLDEKLLSLVEQIPQEYAPLIDALSKWALDFNFDKVIQLIQSNSEIKVE